MLLPALPGAGRCSSHASCPASWLKFASGRLLGSVSAEKSNGWWVRAYVSTLHSDGPKVSQALVGTAGPGHGSAPPQGTGSSVAGGGNKQLWSFLVAISSLASCSCGCLGMTPALVLLQRFNPAMLALKS